MYAQQRLKHLKCPLLLLLTCMTHNSKREIVSATATYTMNGWTTCIRSE